MTERVVRAVLTGSSAGAVRAFEETALAAEKAGGRASKAMQESGSKVGESAKSMGEKAKGAFEAMAGGSLIVGGIIGESLKVFGDYQAAMAKLNTAMQDAGTKWTPQLKEQFDKLTDSMTGLGFGTSETADAVSRLVTAGIPATTAMSDMGTIADLARFKHISLADATDMVTKATMGSARALKDLGITSGPVVATSASLQSAQTALTNAQAAYTAAVEKHGPKSAAALAASTSLAKAQANLTLKQKEMTDTLGHFGGVVGLIEPKIKGQAEAYSHTLPGALSVLKASIEDKVLIPLGQKLMPAFLAISNWIGAHSADISNVLGKAFDILGTAMNVVGTIAGDVGKAIGWVRDHFDALAPVLAAITAALVALGVVWAYNSIMGTYAAGLAAVSAALGIDTGMTSAATVATTAFGAALELATGPIGIAIIAIMAIVAIGVVLIKHWDQVKAAAENVWHAVSGFFTNLWGDITGGIDAVVGFVRDHWMLLVGILTGPFGLAVAFVVTHFGQIRDFVGGVFGDVVNIINTIPMTLMGIGYHIMNALKYPFQAAFHFIAQAWNNTLGNMSLSIPSWVPLVGGNSWSIPKLSDPGMPSLDIGGEVLSTGLAIVHRGEVYSGVHGETAMGRGDNVTTNVTINVMGGDPQAVVNALRAYMRSNGSVPITVNAARRLGAA